MSHEPCENNEELVRRMSITLYGDKAAGTKGMEEKFDEMYQIVVGSKSVWVVIKFIAASVVTLGAMTYGLGQIGDFIKKIFNH